MNCPDPLLSLPEEVLAPEPIPRDADYQDWAPATSFIVSGPLARNPRPGPGRRFTPEEAKRWVEKTYRVLSKIEDAKKQGRWAYRVLKPDAPGGRYTPPPEHTLPERGRKER